MPLHMLSRLRALTRPIRIGIVGVGSAGKGLLFQAGITPGIRCVACAEILPQRAIDAAMDFGLPYRQIRGEGDLQDAFREGVLALCEDGLLLAQADGIDVIIDASSGIEAGGRLAIAAVEHGRHVVMMNAEADLIFGPYLMDLARNRGVVYTSCDGDQPGVIRRLVEDLRLWGFELVMAGNIKGFLDRYANPTTIVPEAAKRDLDPQMCASYTDGTKLCVEMALVANGLGLRTIVPGMLGPRAAHILDIPRIFDLDGLFKDRRPFVDYVLGAEPKGGVFAVGFCDHPYQRHMLDWFPSQLGEGPYYVFRRAYHLIHIEAMQCVAEAFLDHQPLLQPEFGFRANVYAYAKRDLRRGDRLDGVGGYACYGLVENVEENLDRPGLPICLARDVTCRDDIPRDRKILLDDVICDPDRFDVQLFQKAMGVGHAG